MTLPPLITLQDHGGDPVRYLDRIYDIFLQTIVRANLKFLGRAIRCAWHPSHDNRHFSFWHVISASPVGNKEESERLPDLRRCERIEWVAHVINNAANETEIFCWQNTRQTNRGTSNHVVLYLHAERYLVILREKGNCYQLVTAYCVENDHTHRKLLKEKETHPDPRRPQK